VERVGVRSTRIRSIDGQRVVVDKNDLLDNELENLDDLPRRRMVHCIGATYDTPANTVAKIPRFMEDITISVEGVDFGRAHLVAFVDSSLLFEFVYYVPSSDYAHALDPAGTESISVPAGHENHAYGRESSELLGVVAGAAGQMGMGE